jgi:hypothetical protein
MRWLLCTALRPARNAHTQGTTCRFLHYVVAGVKSNHDILTGHAHNEDGKREAKNLPEGRFFERRCCLAGLQSLKIAPVLADGTIFAYRAR